ncbi:hypothetical protein D3C87_664310 [compost metagenome]
MDKLTFTPSEAIKGKFKVVNTIFPIFHSRIGQIDFRTITEEEAEKLVAAGTIYLERVKTTKAKKTIS